MAGKQTKKYKLRGKVLKVYEVREVSFGNRSAEVTDVSLQLENGKKIKVCFWDQDVEGIEGCKVLITFVTYKGEYRGTHQYSSTKDTQVEVLEQGSGEAGEDEVPGAEKDVAEPEDVEEEGGDEPDEVDEPEEKPKKVTKNVAKKATKTTVKEDSYTVADRIKALAEESMVIAGDIAPDHVKEDAQAFQATFATIFIQLVKEAYFASQKK